MAIKHEVIVAFFEGIEKLEDEKKEIATTIKESFEAFAVNQELNKKAVQIAYKSYTQWKKDNAEFVELDFAAEELLLAAVPELCTTDASEVA